MKRSRYFREFLVRFDCGHERVFRPGYLSLTAQKIKYIMQNNDVCCVCPRSGVARPWTLLRVQRGTKVER